MLGVREGLRLWILGLDTQGLLDPYESLEYVRKRENLSPMVIYRILDEF